MSSPSILIVEDEAIVAADLANKLQQSGYRVAGSVASGEEAVALVRQQPPDLVLMDLRLAGAMDGIAAAEAIRRECDLPVVFLTAHSDTATLDRAKLAEPFGYIIKPFEERELRTSIEMALYKHQADRQVREQREWFRVTLASIGDAVIACDTESRITFLNPVAETLTGWTTEEVLSQPIQRVFRPINEQTRQPCDDPVAHVLREGRPVALANHTALITSDGREVPIEDSAAPILDAAGRVIGAVLVFHDVTEKRRAEEALATAHQWRLRILESIGEGFFALDGEHRVTFINERGAQLLGKSRAELLNRSLWESFPEAVGSGFHRAYQKAMAEQVPVSVEESYPPLNAWFEARAHPSPEGLSVFYRNVTERKQREDGLAFLARCGLAPGEDFLHSLARYLAETLAMDFVCIDQLEGDSLTARTVAVYCDGKFEDNVSYALKDTPCGEVVGRTICCFPSGVRPRFPKDAVLQELAAESYAGVTLWGFDGRPIGLIAVIGRRPLANPQLAESLLQLVAGRAAGELERLRAEEALRLSLEASRQRQAEITTLLKGARSVLEHPRFLPAARAIYDACKELIGVQAGYVALLRDTNKEYDLLFLDSGGAACTVDPSLPMPLRGLRAEAYRTRQAVYDNAFPVSAHAALLPEGHLGLQNVLFAPLLLGGGSRRFARAGQQGRRLYRKRRPLGVGLCRTGRGGPPQQPQPGTAGGQRGTLPPGGSQRGRCHRDGRRQRHHPLLEPGRGTRFRLRRRGDPGATPAAARARSPPGRASTGVRPGPEPGIVGTRTAPAGNRRTEKRRPRSARRALDGDVAERPGGVLHRDCPRHHGAEANPGGLAASARRTRSPGRTTHPRSGRGRFPPRSRGRRPDSDRGGVARIRGTVSDPVRRRTGRDRPHGRVGSRP
jgi:PAS domain S-box-containing protein